MASSASVTLKRRLSGGGQARSDETTSVCTDITPFSSGRTRAARDKDRRHLDQGKEIKQTPNSVSPAGFAALSPDTPNSTQSTNKIKAASWGWASKTWSFLAPEAEETSPATRLQGLEAFNVVRRAADGIASTATAMATSLDETVEQLFVGWTPAPPAADHTPPAQTPLGKPNPRRTLRLSEAKQKADAADKENAGHARADSWDDWGSSFGSRSPSPDLQAKCQTGIDMSKQSAIAAWRAADAMPLVQQQQQQALTPARSSPSRATAGALPLPRSSAPMHQQVSRPFASGNSTGEEVKPARATLPTRVTEGSSAQPVSQPGRPGPHEAQAPASAAAESSGQATSPEHLQKGAAADQKPSRQQHGGPAAGGLASEGCSPSQLQQQQQRGQSSSPERDPLADQMAGQMQALLAEKARLTQENDRLARENTGLQELLQYTRQQHLPEAAEGLDDWATLESALPEGEPIPSVENGSPLISPR